MKPVEPCKHEDVEDITYEHLSTGQLSPVAKWCKTCGARYRFGSWVSPTGPKGKVTADTPTAIEPGDPRESFMRDSDGNLHGPATTAMAALQRLRASALSAEPYVPRKITNKDYEQVEAALHQLGKS